MRGYKSVLFKHFLFLIDVIARLVVVKRGFKCFYLLLFCCCLLFSSFLLLLDLPPITMKLWNFLKPILNIGMPPHGTFYRRRRSAYFSRTALVVVSDPKRKRCVPSCRPHLKKRNGLNTNHMTTQKRT